jgi:hypothetical protein
MIDPNEGAFPISIDIRCDSERTHEAFIGLTKREYAAIHILAGIWANPASSGLERGEAAKAAVDQTDLLLEALESTP